VSFGRPGEHVAEIPSAAATKIIVTATGATIGNRGILRSKTFRYTTTDATVIMRAVTMNAAVALGLRVARSDRDTIKEITYGIHAIAVIRIGDKSA
jgi:hypothetical protein